MDVWQIAGMAAALIAVIYLIYIGKKREYGEYFLGNIIVQAIFTLGAWLALRKLFPTFKYLPAVLGALSFIFPLMGKIMADAPDRRDIRKREELKDRIRNGKKYREFREFIKAHRDAVAAVTYKGEVRYSDTIPLFVERDRQGETTFEWNPKLGYPHRFEISGYEKKGFFTPDSNEREWTSEEQYLIRDLIKETLDSIGSFHEDPEDQIFRRTTPEAKPKKGLKDPY